MEKLTELYIYALKDRGPGYVEEATLQFMSRHKQFKNMTLEQAVRHFWLDYLSTADNPQIDMRHMLEQLDMAFDFDGLIQKQDVAWAMMRALKKVKDRDENFKFINGFGEDYK